MSDVPLHRLYRHYSELPYSQRVLCTMTLLVLGLGYLFALIYLFHTYAGRAGGNPMMLSYNDILTAYTGSGKGSRLESALRGPMSTMLPHDEANTLIAWVHEGADRAKYESDIEPLLDQRCMGCHDGSNPHIPNLNGYDNLKKVTEQDPGEGRLHAGSRIAHPPVRADVHLLHHGPDVQPRVRPPGMVQVRRRRRSVRRRHHGHQLVVPDEAISSVRLGRHDCRRIDGAERSPSCGSRRCISYGFPRRLLRSPIASTARTLGESDG